MKSLFLVCALSSLLTSACGAKEVSTFGLTVDYADARPGAGLCVPAGSNKSTSSLTLDVQKPSGANVWLEVEQNFEKESAYFVRVGVGPSYVETVPGEFTAVGPARKVLVERRYDEGFATSGNIDTFDVSIEGKTLPVAVKGLPAQASCPKFPIGTPDGGLRE